MLMTELVPLDEMLQVVEDVDVLVQLLVAQLGELLSGAVEALPVTEDVADAGLLAVIITCAWSLSATRIVVASLFRCVAREARLRSVCCALGHRTCLLEAMAPSLEALAKLLSQLEKAHDLTSKLAVQTDLDVQRERLRRQVVFHLRGDLLCKMEEIYKEHQARPAARSEGDQKRPRRVAALPVP